MRFSLIWALTRKDLLDILRDRRTLLAMLLLPFVLYPLIGIGASQIRLLRKKEIQTTRFTVGVVGGRHTPQLIRSILNTYDVRYLKPKQHWKKLLQTGRLSSVLRITTQSTASTSKKSESLPVLRQFHVQLSYVWTRDTSRSVHKRLLGLLKKFQRDVLHRRLQEHGLPIRFIRPVQITTYDLATRAAKGRHALGMFFPLLLIILTVTGAFYPAIDLTAGEKERGTLETLLTAPISTLEIVAGKYIAIWCIASCAGLLNLASFWFTFAHGMRLAGIKAGIVLGLQLHHYVIVVVFLVLFAALSSAVMIAIASLARSFKEAQNYVAPAYLSCVFPAMLPAFPGFKATWLMACLPVVNVAFAIQQAINARIEPVFFVLSLASMCVSIGLALWLASRIFAMEHVLFRGDSFAFLKRESNAKRPWRDVFSWMEISILLGALFVATFYIIAPLQMAHPAWGLIVQLWGLILLLPLLIARARKIDIKKSIPLHRPSLWECLGAVTLVLGLLPVISGVTQLVHGALFPDWLQFVKAANRTFSLQHFGVGPVAFFLLISISPGVCEEFLFRGFVLSSLRKKLPFWSAIVLTALLFGAFHMHLYRLLPTTLIGIVLGWLCLRTRSIWPAILGHMVNNAAAMSFSLLGRHVMQLEKAAQEAGALWMGIEQMHIVPALFSYSTRIPNGIWVGLFLVLIVGGVGMVLKGSSKRLKEIQKIEV